MDTEKNLDSPAAAGSSPAAPRSSSRRRLLQAGLAASPGLLTIVSEPVRAFGQSESSCRSASAFASISAAAAANITLSAGAAASICIGLKPTSWQANFSNVPSTWPTGTTTKTFYEVFGSAPPSGDSTTTLKAVLDLSPTTNLIDMAQYFVAAYLNLQQGYVGAPPIGLTETKLQQMWLLASTTGYTPIAGGAPWPWIAAVNANPPGLKNWFSAQMPN